MEYILTDNIDLCYALDYKMNGSLDLVIHTSNNQQVLKNVFVEIIENTIKCYETNPNLSNATDNEIPTLISYDLLTKELTMAKSVASNGIASFAFRDPISDSIVEFLCPNNSTKFHWMKAIDIVKNTYKSNSENNLLSKLSAGRNKSSNVNPKSALDQDNGNTGKSTSPFVKKPILQSSTLRTASVRMSSSVPQTQTQDRERRETKTIPQNESSPSKVSELFNQVDMANDKSAISSASVDKLLSMSKLNDSLNSAFIDFDIQSTRSTASSIANVHEPLPTNPSYTSNPLFQQLFAGANRSPPSHSNSNNHLRTSIIQHVPTRPVHTIQPAQNAHIAVRSPPPVAANPTQYSRVETPESKFDVTLKVLNRKILGSSLGKFLIVS